eukprot:gene10829-11981_t
MSSIGASEHVERQAKTSQSIIASLNVLTNNIPSVDAISNGEDSSTVSQASQPTAQKPKGRRGRKKRVKPRSCQLPILPKMFAIQIAPQQSNVLAPVNTLISSTVLPSPVKLQQLPPMQTTAPDAAPKPAGSGTELESNKVKSTTPSKSAKPGRKKGKTVKESVKLAGKFHYASNNSQPAEFQSKDIVLSGGFPQQNRKRIVHNATEKRRKEKINGWIGKIASILFKYNPEQQHKIYILEKAYDFIAERTSKQSEHGKSQDAFTQSGSTDNSFPELVRKIAELENLVDILMQLLNKYKIPFPQSCATSPYVQSKLSNVQSSSFSSSENMRSSTELVMGLNGNFVTVDAGAQAASLAGGLSSKLQSSNLQPSLSSITSECLMPSKSFVWVSKSQGGIVNNGGTSVESMAGEGEPFLFDDDHPSGHVTVSDAMNNSSQNAVANDTTLSATPIASSVSVQPMLSGNSYSFVIDDKEHASGSASQSLSSLTARLEDHATLSLTIGTESSPKSGATFCNNVNRLSAQDTVNTIIHNSMNPMGINFPGLNSTGKTTTGIMNSTGLVSTGVMNSTGLISTGVMNSTGLISTGVMNSTGLTSARAMYSTGLVSTGMMNSTGMTSAGAMNFNGMTSAGMISGVNNHTVMNSEATNASLSRTAVATNFTTMNSTGIISASPISTSLNVRAINSSALNSGTMNSSVMHSTSKKSAAISSGITMNSGIMTSTTMNFGTMNSATVNSGTMNSASMSINKVSSGSTRSTLMSFSGLNPNVSNSSSGTPATIAPVTICSTSSNSKPSKSGKVSKAPTMKSQMFVMKNMVLPRLKDSAMTVVDRGMQQTLPSPQVVTTSYPTAIPADPMPILSNDITMPIGCIPLHPIDDATVNVNDATVCSGIRSSNIASSAQSGQRVLVSQQIPSSVGELRLAKDGHSSFTQISKTLATNSSNVSFGGLQELDTLAQSEGRAKQKHGKQCVASEPALQPRHSVTSLLSFNNHGNASDSQTLSIDSILTKKSLPSNNVNNGRLSGERTAVAITTNLTHAASKSKSAKPICAQKSSSSTVVAARKRSLALGSDVGSSSSSALDGNGRGQSKRARRTMNPPASSQVQNFGVSALPNQAGNGLVLLSNNDNGITKQLEEKKARQSAAMYNTRRSDQSDAPTPSLPRPHSIVSLARNSQQARLEENQKRNNNNNNNNNNNGLSGFSAESLLRHNSAPSQSLQQQQQPLFHSTHLNSTITAQDCATLPTILNIFAPASVASMMATTGSAASLANMNNNNPQNQPINQFSLPNIQSTFSNFSAEALIGGGSVDSQPVLGNQLNSVQTDNMLSQQNLFTDFSADTLLAGNESGLSYGIDNIMNRNESSISTSCISPTWLQTGSLIDNSPIRNSFNPGFNIFDSTAGSSQGHKVIVSSSANFLTPSKWRADSNKADDACPNPSNIWGSPGFAASHKTPKNAAQKQRNIAKIQHGSKRGPSYGDFLLVDSTS